MGQHLNKKFFVQQRKLSTKWEDIFVNDTSYKRFISKIYKEFIQLNTKEKPIQLNWQRI